MLLIHLDRALEKLTDLADLLHSYALQWIHDLALSSTHLLLLRIAGLHSETRSHHLLLAHEDAAALSSRHLLSWQTHDIQSSLGRMLSLILSKLLLLGTILLETLHLLWWIASTILSHDILLILLLACSSWLHIHFNIF